MRSSSLLRYFVEYFSYVLAATSPAVTVPALIQLQDEGRGVEKGIPTGNFFHKY